MTFIMIPRLDLPARQRTNDVRQARQSSWPEPRVKSGLTEFSKRPWFYILGVVFHYVNSWLSSKRLGFDPVVLCVRYSGVARVRKSVTLTSEKTRPRDSGACKAAIGERS